MSAFIPAETIRRKRDGEVLDAAEIGRLVAGIGEGTVTDAQIAAFAMAVFLRGMERSETVALTLAMRDSGDVLDWRDFDRPVADKHSTGGVGDNVSLMLAPIVAACGALVPMISGRGLGHTGGTLDKLEAIPGYRVAPDRDALRRTIGEAGCAVVGPTARLAPADGRIYAVRDVTATVESIPLITASILSKKLAAGLGALVLDVKTGSGAFMAKRENARHLARSLVEVAQGAGLPAAALVTAMDEPLARDAGNALEVRDAALFLTGARRDPRPLAVTLALAGEMLSLAGLASDAAGGERMAREALESGRAAERFARMVAGLGGPADLLERPDAHLPRAPIVLAVAAPGEGTVAAWDTRSLGLAVVALGGGRTRPGDPVDPAVGLADILPVGSIVRRGDPVALVHARDASGAAEASVRVLAALRLGDATAPVAPVLERIG